MEANDSWNVDELADAYIESESEEESDNELALLQKDIKLLRQHNEEDSDVEIIDTGPGSLQENCSLNQILESKDNLQPTKSNVLVINQAIIKSLQNLHRSMKLSLKNNRDEQESLKNKLAALERKDKQDVKEVEYPHARICGIPYFKFESPKNIYQLHMEKYRFLFPIELIKRVSSWYPQENKKLIELTVNFMKEAELERLERDLKQIVRRGCDEKSLVDIKLELEKVKSGIFDKKCCKVDWLRVAASLNEESQFTAEECEARWNLVLSPKYNHSKWKQEEYSKLFELAQRFYFQNWEKIASKLGTNRCAIQCCLRFQRDFLQKTHQWSAKEDEKLSKLVQQYSRERGYIPWKTIFFFFENRSLRQIRERYLYRLKPQRKGVFSKDEDAKIMQVAEAYKGDTRLLYRFFPQRSIPALRFRYNRLLDTKLGFTGEEDRKLLEAVRRHGKDWNAVVEELPGRLLKEVKTRYFKLLEFSEEILASMREKEDSTSDILPPLPGIHREAAIWTLLQLMSGNQQSPGAYSLSGLRLDRNMSTSLRMLLRMMEFGHDHLFGPRFGQPRTQEETDGMARRFSFICMVSAVPCDFTYICGKNFCRYNIPVRLELFLPLKDIPTTVFSPIPSMCWVPPSPCTLHGLRILGEAKTYLLAEAILTKSLTWRDETIDKETRISASIAKSRLESRILHIFFLSTLLSRISKSDEMFVTNKGLKAPKRRKPKPTTKLQFKKKAKEMAALRWGRKPKKIKAEVATTSDGEAAAPVVKKAKMIHVSEESGELKKRTRSRKSL